MLNNTRSQPPRLRAQVRRLQEALLALARRAGHRTELVTGSVQGRPVGHLKAHDT